MELYNPTEAISETVVKLIYLRRLNQARPRAFAGVGAAILSVGRKRGPGCGAAAFSGTCAADMGPRAIVPDELLSGVRDMGAQGGQEVECWTGNRAWRIRAGATLMMLGGVGNLSHLGIIV